MQSQATKRFACPTHRREDQRRNHRKRQPRHLRNDNTVPNGVQAQNHEAYYVLAVINSNELGNSSKAALSHQLGQDKFRHFQKHGWKLPIPRYDANDRCTYASANWAQLHEQECQALIAEQRHPTKPAGDAQSRAARKPAAPRVAA